MAAASTSTAKPISVHLEASGDIVQHFVAKARNDDIRDVKNFSNFLGFLLDTRQERIFIVSACIRLNV
jgi:ketosteroid isomerase-like protein